MKKFLTILLAGVMTLSLTACSSKKDEPTPGQNTNQVEGATPAATSDGIDPSGYKGTVMLYSSTGEDVVIALKNAFSILFYFSVHHRLSLFYDGAFQNAIDIFAFNFIIFAFSTDLSSAFNAWAVHLA